MRRCAVADRGTGRLRADHTRASGRGLWPDRGRPSYTCQPNRWRAPTRFHRPAAALDRGKDRGYGERRRCAAWPDRRAAGTRATADARLLEPAGRDRRGDHAGWLAAHWRSGTHGWRWLLPGDRAQERNDRGWALQRLSARCR